MKKIISRICLFLLMLILTSCLASCSNSEPTDPISLVVIVGNRGNSGQFSDSNYLILFEYLRQAWLINGNDADALITLVVSDGNPAEATPLGSGGGELSLRVRANSRQIRDEEIESRTLAVERFIRSSDFRAVSEEADLIGALFRAADVLRETQNPEHEKHIVILDSGITTTGHLNMTRVNIQEIRPGDIVDELYRINALPELSGINVTFLGLGNVGHHQSMPQDTALRNNLVALWTGIIDASGGTLTSPIVFSSPGRPRIYPAGGGDDDDERAYPFVSTVAFRTHEIPVPTPIPTPTPVTPSPPPSEPETTPVIPTPTPPVPTPTPVRPPEPPEFSSVELGFLPNSPDFRDAVNARNIIRARMDAYWSYLGEDERIFVVGSIARTNDSRNRDVRSYWLSEERARRVANILIAEYDLNPNRVVIVDAGNIRLPWQLCEFRTGTLDRAIQERNRMVTVLFESMTEELLELRSLGLLG